MDILVDLRMFGGWNKTSKNIPQMVGSSWRFTFVESRKTHKEKKVFVWTEKSIPMGLVYDGIYNMVYVRTFTF